MEGSKCNCPNCGQEIQVDENLIGAEFACPVCSEPVLVQADNQEDSEAPSKQTLIIAEPVEAPGKLRIPLQKNKKNMNAASPAPMPSSAKEEKIVDPVPAIEDRNDTNSGKSSNLIPLLHLMVSVLTLIVMGVFLTFFILKMQEAAAIANKQEEHLAAQGKELTAQGKELAAQGKELAAQGKELVAQGKELAAQGKELAVQSKHLAAIEKIQGTHSIYFSALALPVYEYKIVEVNGVSFSSMSPNKFSGSDLQKTLNLYKDWELVDVIEITETVHPNFGKSEYVTGLQPNVRTGQLQLILRKRK